METVPAPTTPQVIPPAPANAVPVMKPEATFQDIIKQVGSIKPEAEKSDEPTLPPVNLDEIKDPQARAYLEKRIKEMESGLNKKFMDVASKSKEADRIKAEYEAKLNAPYTPQRIQELLQRPDFVQSAQTLQQMAPPTNFEGNQEQWSNLSEGEKQRIQNAESLSRQTQSQLNQILMLQIDQRISNRFPDYDSKAVDGFFKEAYEGRVPDEQLREMIHKALNFDRYVTNAYKYRMEDDATLNKDKINGVSHVGLETQFSDEKPKIEKGERPRDFFRRLANFNMNRLQNTKK